jgi:hypothetical protein
LKWKNCKHKHNLQKQSEQKQLLKALKCTVVINLIVTIQPALLWSKEMIYYQSWFVKKKLCKKAAKEKKNLSVISVTYAKVLFEIDMSLFSYLA